jgi:hypothetical protein
MRRPILLALLACALPVTARAQIGYTVRAGGVWSTKIVRDVIYAPIETRPGIAPALAVGADLAMNRQYRVGLELGVASAGVTTTTPTQPGSDISQGRVWLLSGMLQLGGELRSRLDWRAGLGLLHYAPTEHEGIFAQGGTTRALFGGGLDYHVTHGRRGDVIVSARYDYHRFSTPELRSQGFTLEQGVQRLSLSVGLTRAPR